MSHQQRADTRRKNIFKTVKIGAYAKGVMVVVSMVMVPLAVNYLGVEQYGLWVAVSSFVAMLSLMDGGVGNAIVNMVSHATGAHSDRSIRDVISSGLFSLLVIAVLGSVLFVLLCPAIPWEWVFGLDKNTGTSGLLTVVLIVGVAFFANVLFSAVGKIQRGFQEGNIEAFWIAKGQILSLCFVGLVIWLEGGLPWFALAWVMGPITACLGNNLYYFLVRKRELIPRISYVRSDTVKEMIGVGGMFFVLQITATIQSQADNIIIANMLGPAAVTPYAICMQLFLVVPMIMGLIWTPIWPAYREALASGDGEWIRMVFLKTIKLALLVGFPASLVLVMFGQDIVRLWVGDKVIPSPWLLIGFGIWQVFMLVGNALAMLLNAVQWLKVQIIIATSAGVSNILLTIFLIDKIGVDGAIWGTVVSYLICVLIPYSVLVPRLLRYFGEQKNYHGGGPGNMSLTELNGKRV